MRVWATADHYSLAARSFWDRLGAATVRLPLTAGHTALDLWRSAGASAIPAARESLANIEFRCSDATRTRCPTAA